MPPVTLAQARRAKLQLKAMLGDEENVVGIGVTKSKDGYAVKLNLRKSRSGAQIPSTIDGVSIVSEIVGTIRAR